MEAKEMDLMNIEWVDVAFVVSAVLLLIAGGYIKQLSKEIKELAMIFSAAMDDSKISKKELAKIIKEAKDVKAVILDIARHLQRR